MGTTQRGAHSAPSHTDALPFQTVTDKSTRRVFRKSAQGFVVNEQGLFLAGTPVGNGNDGFLQTVQGGMEHEEDEQATLAREFEEEIGLTVGEHLTFIAQIVPTRREAGGSVSTDDLRQPFRYSSKSWRKLGVAGQQLCPNLYFADSSSISACRLQPTSSETRREFKSVAWTTLPDLLRRTPPAKRAVLEAIVPFVSEAAEGFLSQYYPDACKMLQHQHRRGAPSNRDSCAKRPRESVEVSAQQGSRVSRKRVREAH